MSVKCVVWDLDNTLWEGVLLEGDELLLKAGVPQVLKTLDTWGILHSIASQNDYTLAMSALERFAIAEFFLAPQINFSPKPEQIASIAATLDLRIEDLAFVDDDAFQRAEVKASFPGLTVLTDAEGLMLPTQPGVQPAILTPQTAERRSFYRSRLERDNAEAKYIASGHSRVEFLQSCQLILRIRPANMQDTRRLFELVERTNQLNASAQRYPFEDVQGWIDSSGYEVWVGELSDRFGEYGLVGLAVIEKASPWLIKVLLVSCRAMGRGVGEGLLTFVLGQAHRQAQVEILAIYRKTPYNNAMRLLLATHGFIPKPEIIRKSEETVIYRRSLTGNFPAAPAWLEIISPTIE